MRQAWVWLVLLAAGCGGGGGSSPSTAPFGLDQRVPVTGLTFPTGLAQPTPLAAVVAFPMLTFQSPVVLTSASDGSDRIFVAELGGRILVFPNDPAVTSSAVVEFLNLTAAQGGELIQGGEQGLLGLAFHPDYANNGYFYVNYTVGQPRRTRVSRFQVSASDQNQADPASELVILEMDQPASNHNGGCLAFGPDGMLYVSTGDGGFQHDPNNRAQDLSDLLGKFLRLNDDGSVPVDNPFVGQAGVRPEIWALGFRNPWRFSFDRVTGELWCGDVGQNAIEEVDRVVRGGNYGWDSWEGSAFHEGTGDSGSFVPPVIEYTHALGVSITGGYVYRGANLPAFQGAYLYGDFGTGRVWALVVDGSQVLENVEVAGVSSPASFGEDESGELYVCSFDGNIYYFEEITPTPPPVVPSLLSETGLFSDVDQLIPAPGLVEYEVNVPFWSDGASKRRWVALPGSAEIEFSAAAAWDFPLGTVLVKHFEIPVPGGIRRLETRVLVHAQSGWTGYTYRWNNAQTDADRLTGSLTETITVEEDGAAFDVDWYYPDAQDCQRCHTAVAGHILGLVTPQLQRRFDFGNVVDNQLRTWNHIGMFTTDIGPHTAYPAMSAPDQIESTVSDRARSYLSANCSQCHRPSGPTTSALDLRYQVGRDEWNAIDVVPNASANGDPNSRLIAPFSKESSEIWVRLGALNQWRMPPLASHRLDAVGLDLIGAWIDQGAP